MKVLSRDFNLKEKLLLAVLALILVGLMYYQFVDKSVRTSLENYKAEEEQLQMELDAAQARLARLTKVKNSLEETEGKYAWMGSYNSSKEELAFLNTVLADTLQYSISFSNVTRNGDQIRRSFTLQYVTATYEAAQDIIKLMLEGKYRCLVGDIRCTVAANGSVTMNQSATFYETMVGGVPDAALPKDSGSVNK